MTGLEEVEDLLFHIEKNAVEDFSRNVRDILLDAKFSVHEYVCPAVVNEYADEFKQAANKVRFTRGKQKDYSTCVEPLQKLKTAFEEGGAKEMPNYFAYAYYLRFGHGEELPKESVKELNVFLRKYLDDNFMLDFISDAKQGIVYSFNQSLEKKKFVVEQLKAKRSVFIDGEPDKKLYKSTAKELAVAVDDSINKLALVKDSTAYTFKGSLLRAINTYFDAIPNNAKEQKRFDREQAKYDKLIAAAEKPPITRLSPQRLSILKSQDRTLSAITTN